MAITPTNEINYLYDREDVVDAPKLFVGLANSAVQKAELRRRTMRMEIAKSALPAEDAWQYFDLGGISTATGSGIRTDTTKVEK